MPAWRRWLGTAFLALVAILVLVTALPVIETDEWWVRIWDYPRVQIAALLIPALIGLVVFHRHQGAYFWSVVAAGAAALASQAWHIARYLPLWPVEVTTARQCPQGRQVRLLNANVLLTNRDYGALIQLVRRTNPDVVLLLEPGKEWEEAARPLYRAYPYRVSQPLPNAYGMILLSKLPLEAPRIRYLMQPHIPSVKAGLRLPSGDVVDFYGIHPEPPLPGDDSGERDAELVQVGKEVRNNSRAAIVMGDLNDVAWSHTSRLFKRLSGTLDPRIGRGLYPTFPANLPLLAWPLDHLFVTPHFRLMAIDALGDIGSDHWPMLFSLCHTRDAGAQIVPRTVPAEVKEEAVDQLEEGREQRAQENVG